MAGVNLKDKVRQKRRDEGRNWSVNDEKAWLEDYPDDEPLPGYDLLLEEETHDDDLIPELDASSHIDEELDRVLDRIGIIEAYNKWAGKGHAHTNGKTESIKVRCPSPEHPDHNPSAWINTDKNVWACGGCGMQGGDKFDIAAWHFGMPVPGYKRDKFPELKKAMAADFGYVVRGDVATKVVAPVVTVSSSSEEGSPVRSLGGDEQQPSATVTPLHVTPEPELLEMPAELRIDWEKLTTDDSFLRAWMEATTQDDLPEEYHFWNGMTALGLAAGNDVYLEDYSPVYGNLFVVIVGGTGTGKSRSSGYLADLLHTAIPYDPSDSANTGVQVIKGIASGEALIDSFVEIHDDAGAPYTVPVRGLMVFDELASLIGKGSQTGSVLKPTLMEIYDKSKVIGSRSRARGRVDALDAFGSCITSTQPKALHRLLGQSDLQSGFLNRWVFAFGVPKELVSYGGAVIDLAVPAKKLETTKRWAATRRPLGMVLADEPLAIWDGFFKSTIAPLHDVSFRKGDDENDPLLARLALTFKKLILLLAIDRKEIAPSAQTVTDAVSLWPYISTTYGIFGVSLASTETRELEERIIHYLRSRHVKGKQGATKKDIVDACKHVHEREDIRKAIDRLEQLGTIEEIVFRKPGARGLPTKLMALSEAS